MPLPSDLFPTPAWSLHLFDTQSDAVLLLRRSEDEYRAAAFLGTHPAAACAPQQAVAWSELATAVPSGARQDAQYIFHIGHVGSTLVSRLLGEIEGVFALREPLPLRSFAERLAGWTDAEARLDTLTALLSRTFRPDQRALVKATSFTSEIAWRLVPDGARALLLFATAETYIANILAGDNSRAELHALTPSRIQRLRSRAPDFEPGPLGEARAAALGWACEMISLEASAARLGERAMWLDFDRFLDAPAPQLESIARFFGHAIEPAAAASICAGPLMRRYSKALEFDYSPTLRREVLADAQARHGPAIRDALAWLDQLGARHPAIGRALRRGE